MGRPARSRPSAQPPNDPDCAAEAGNQAVDAASTVRSTRVNRYLHTLHAAAARHAGRPPVDTLRARTADLLLA